MTAQFVCFFRATKTKILCVVPSLCRWVLFRASEGDKSAVVVVPLPEDHHDGVDRHGLQPRSPALDAMSSDNSSVHASVSQAVNPVHGWGFSASPYSLETLDEATHDHELRADPGGRVHVHFDSRTMGLGGYDSWSPNVDEAFLVMPHLPPMSLRKATMPTSIAPKSLRAPQTPLQVAIRLIPWPDA
jgi:hypothetical protein